MVSEGAPPVSLALVTVPVLSVVPVDRRSKNQVVHPWSNMDPSFGLTQSSGVCYYFETKPYSSLGWYKGGTLW